MRNPTDSPNQTLCPNGSTCGNVVFSPFVPPTPSCCSLAAPVHRSDLACGRVGARALELAASDNSKSRQQPRGAGSAHRHMLWAAYLLCLGARGCWLGILGDAIADEEMGIWDWMLGWRLPDSCGLQRASVFISDANKDEEEKLCSDKLTVGAEER